jgi:hypothetical protein
LKYLIFLLFTLNFSIVFAENSTLSLHKISYKLYGSGFELGTENRVLTKHGDLYSYQANAKTEGFAKLIKNYKVDGKSLFVIDDGVKSQKFNSIEYDGDKVKKNINLNFDKVITNNITKNSWKNNENNGCVDFLSMFLAIGYDLKNHNQFSYCLADGKKIKNYTFENQGQVELNLMDSKISATKLVSNDIEVYMSKDYRYLPVLIKKKKWKYEIKSVSFQN